MISAIRHVLDVCAIALLCLVCMSLSAPLSCEDLVRPLDKMDPRHLEGRRALVAGSISKPEILEIFKRRDSASVNFSKSNDTVHISYSISLRLDGKCIYSSYNITKEGSNFTYEGISRSNLTGSFIYTSCRDCILLRLDKESEQRVHLYLFSRRRELEVKEMEEFRSQVECLQMPPPAVLDPNKELCPDQPTPEPAAAQTEEKTEKPKD